MRVINFFGGPGAGKSTAASGLFYEMKKKWVSAELVTEFAKELVWSGSSHMLSHQNLVFANQEHRLNRLQGKVELAVSDSPLLLSAYYAPPHYPISFKQSVFDFFNSYENINIFVRRSHEYASEGRLQGADDADSIAETMEEFLLENGIPYYAITASDAGPRYLLHWLVNQGLITLPSYVKGFEPEDQPPPGWIEPSLKQKLDAAGVPVGMGAAVDQRFVRHGVRTSGEGQA